MLGSARIVAFAGTRDRDRARTFYRDTLGLRLVHEDDFALVFNVSGVTLRVTLVGDVVPAGYTVLGWEVPDVADAASQLTAAGVRLERYRGLEQDEFGVWTAPSGARVAWFRDPDGNLLSVSQSG